MSGKLNFQVVPLAEIPKDDLLSKAQQVVLVVDDEHVIADTLAAILSRSGYMAMTAYDGVSALEIATAIPPQMLITDVYMPGVNGINLAVSLRKMVPDCKVLLFSGQVSTVDLLSEARNAGYDFAAVAKPIHPTELLACVSRFLSDTPDRELSTAALPFQIRQMQRDAQPA